jgi:Ser/Thr protein kinase RdoA (MazF antagonist)
MSDDEAAVGMADVEELRAHLVDRYAIHVQAMLTLDQDVILMRRSDGPSWVARVFGGERPADLVQGDAEILKWLAQVGYPAERCATEQPVSTLDGRAVLVTEAVTSARGPDRRKAIKDAGGIRRLGELLGALATIRVPSGAPSRPGGAWHHLATGGPAAELEAATVMLEEAEARAPARELGVFTSLTEELDSLDAGEGLPEGFLHPDFVLANVVATTEPGMVLVDWAGAGVGPRLWALAFLLWAEAAKDPRRAALALAGYRQHVRLEPEELERLPAMMRARPLIFDIWRLRGGTKSAAAVAADALETRRLVDTIARRLAARLREP